MKMYSQVAKSQDKYENKKISSFLVYPPLYTC